MGAQAQKTTVSEAKAQAASAFSTYFKTLGANGEVTSVQEVISEVKSMLSSAVESCLQGEMDAFLGYKKSAFGAKPATTDATALAPRRSRPTMAP